MSFEEYVRYDALGLAQLVRRGEVSPDELLDAALARTAAVNPRINAVIHLMEARARAAIAAGLPDGPFRGVPFLIKDLIMAYGGEPMRGGSRLLRDYVPPRDEELVARHKAAGLVIFGKTNTPELGMANVTEPELFGPSRNPWNPDRTPGGSSGGSAAAVAAGIVPAAGANDGGGSIRTPASNCGLVGLKPSRGRNPSGPQAPELWWGFVAEHAVTRTVRDSAALLDATCGSYAGQLTRLAPPERPYLEETRRDPGPVADRVQSRSRAWTKPAPGEPPRDGEGDECARAGGARARGSAPAGRVRGLHRALRDPGRRRGRRDDPPG